jgi:hypothetical protein
METVRTKNNQMVPTRMDANFRDLTPPWRQMLSNVCNVMIFFFFQQRGNATNTSSTYKGCHCDCCLANVLQDAWKHEIGARRQKITYLVRYRGPLHVHSVVNPSDIHHYPQRLKKVAQK